MDQIQLVNLVIAGERKLDYEADRRRMHRSEPHVNYLAAPQPCRNERTSILARFFRHRRANQTPIKPAEAPRFELT